MSETPLLTQQRHRINLINCRECLITYLNETKQFSSYQNSDSTIISEHDLVLSAEHLRRALKWMGLITGHVTTEQVLDVIFRDFCIGK
jgi:tRNA modification GTPase